MKRQTDAKIRRIFLVARLVSQSRGKELKR